MPSVNLDVDWVYRRALPAVVRGIVRVGGPLKDEFFNGSKALIRSTVSGIRVMHEPQGVWGRTWLTRSSVLVVMAFLALYLIFYF